MLILSAKIRKEFGKKTKTLRKNNILPAILYGPEIKNLPLEINLKEFEKIYKEAGESSLISLDVDGKKFLVLIHEVNKDPLTEKPIHIDFYQPKLKEEIVVKVPIVIEGFSPAVRDMGGTLIRHISEVEVKALPQKLPKEIKVGVENLKSFNDYILIKDLELPEGVKILKDKEEIVISVLPPEKVEEELEKPVEEKVEEVEIVEEKKEKEEKEEGEEGGEEKKEEKAGEEK
jgi:large subunit ribosomal protein L25